MFGAWPRLSDVDEPWFVILAAPEVRSLACLWWLARIALASPDDPVPDGASDRQAQTPPRLGWGTAAAAQLAGNAASKVVPGGAATGGVVQAKVLIQSGQPAGAVASGLTATNLLGTAVLLILPVLTIPALIIGPPPAKQLQLGLLVSLILAAVIVAIGVTALTWPISRGRDRHGHRTCSPCVSEVCDAARSCGRAPGAACAGRRCVSRSLVDGRVRCGREPHVGLRRSGRRLGGIRSARASRRGAARVCGRAGVRDHPDHPRWCGLRRRGTDSASSPGRRPGRHRARSARCSTDSSRSGCRSRLAGWPGVGGGFTTGSRIAG